MKLVKTITTNIIEKVYYHDTYPLKIVDRSVNGVPSYLYTLRGPHKQYIRPVLRRTDKINFWEEQEDVVLQSLDDIDNYKLYLYEYSGGVWFDHTMHILATPSTFDYCDSFLCERERNDKDFAEIIECLRPDPRYSNIEVGEVPYYNSRFHGQKALLRATVFPDQETYERIYENVKTREFWSVRLHNAFRFSYDMFDWSPFDEATTKRLGAFYAKKEKELYE